MDDYLRRCPVCGADNPADASHCAACGTLLIGVDLVRRIPAAEAPPVVAPTLPSVSPPVLPPTLPAEVPAAVPEPIASPVATPAASGVVCPYADCAASNPPGQSDCLYCGRPLSGGEALAAGDAPDAPDAPMAGLYKLPATLAANFSIERVLPAAGAEAELMLLRGTRTGVRVMAKLYRPGVAPKGEVLEQVAEVAHAHVVRLLSHGTSDGLAYEVMEYCTGGSLRDLMREPFARERLHDVLREVAEALAALHAAHVIHRDLKPENVLVRRREPLDLVLTDFGIASLNNATQLFTSLARTARYAAPEALSGVLDAAADYWSLGIILMEILLGEHPFAGLSEPVISHRLATGLVDVDSVADPAWRKLCRGLLLRDPQRRWGIAEIRRWLDKDDTLAEPAPDRPLLAHPYRIEGDTCRTYEELAVAFSRHWAAAAKDLARGQFEAWVRGEMKEQDLLRFLHDLKDRGSNADLALFQLIRHLAPNIPPTWQGVGLAQASLVAQAARAMDGDEEAGAWLTSVFEQRVIEMLPDEAYAAELALAKRWRTAWSDFGKLWRDADKALGDWRAKQVAGGSVVVDVDALMYGQAFGLEFPPQGPLHGSLLLAASGNDVLAARRQALVADATAYLEHSPWLDALLAAAEQVPLARIALHHLLPQARRASQEGQKRVEAQRVATRNEQGGMAKRVNEALANIRRSADRLGSFSDVVERRTLEMALEAFLKLGAEARDMIGRDQDSNRALMRTLERAEPVVDLLRTALDDWESATRITYLWQNEHLVNALLGIAFVVFMVSPIWLIALAAVPILFLLWRAWRLVGHNNTVHRLVKRLPWAVSTDNPG